MHVRLDWADCGQDKGILVIDVPAQPAACLPFLVPGPARTGKDSQQAGALPVRDGDRTRWLSVSDLQRLLAAGWSQNGGSGEEVLRDLLSQAIAATRTAAGRRSSQARATRSGNGASATPRTRSAARLGCGRRRPRLP